MGCSCNIVLIVLILLGAGLIILGAVLGFAVLPNYVEDKVIESVQLKEGTEQYDRWKELPFPLTFKVYIFNVDNVDEIMAGQTPNVTEIGPFVYKQYRRKFNESYFEDDDTWEYEQILNFEFDEFASAPLTDEEIVTVLNAPLQGVLQTAEDLESLVSVANRGWPGAFDADSLFMTIDVKSLLFGGYTFCKPKTIPDIYAQLLCKAIRDKVDETNTLTTNGSTVTFSFFSHKDDHTDGVYKVKAGIDDVNQLGAITLWENSTTLDKWLDDELPDGSFTTSSCNLVRGRDSSIYPPFNNESSNFDIFNTDICRIVTLRTIGMSEYQDVEGNIATLGIDALSNSGAQSCYCIKGTRNLEGKYECLPEGFGDLTTCVGAPVVISSPHFLGADEEYRSTVNGLSPSEADHETFVIYEPGTGTPLQGAKRIQFNIITRPIVGIDITQSLKPAVFPILWVEEGVDLTDDLVEELKDEYLSKIALVDAVKWALIAVGIVLLVASSGYLFIRKYC